MNLFSSLTFATPWLLAALAALPVIWWLLRVTPPAPRRVAFPPLRLLRGLASREETPARTPPWLLLLRLFAAALVIVALAQPEWGEQRVAANNSPLVLFIDNGWTAAQNWSARHAAMSDALEEAGRSGRAVAIVPTAALRPDARLLSAGAAERRAGELAPEAWLPDRKRAVAALSKMKLPASADVFWLSDGIDYGDGIKTEQALAGIGHLRVFADPAGKTPLLVRSLDNEADGFVAHVARLDAIGTQEGDVAALGEQGETLAAAHFHFAPDARVTTAKIPLPLEIRNETKRVIIENVDSVGAVQLLGSGAKRRAVEIVSARSAEDEQPLLSQTYYLSRALAPFSDVQKGTIGDGLARNVAVLALADIGSIAGADHDRVARFVEQG